MRRSASSRSQFLQRKNSQQAGSDMLANSCEVFIREVWVVPRKSGMLIPGDATFQAYLLSAICVEAWFDCAVTCEEAAVALFLLPLIFTKSPVTTRPPCGER